MDVAATFTGDTKIVGRVGIKASKSGNTIYMPLFKQMNFDAVYIQFVVPEDKTADYLNSVKTLGILGSSVTGSHTHSLMELVDVVDETAQVTHHGNCLVNRDGKTTLYSTDVAGMMRTLLPLAETLEGKSVVILGGGALLPGILNELVKHKPKSVTVYNRSVDKLTEVTSKFGAYVGGGLNQLVQEAAGDIFINATHIGSASCEQSDEIFTDEFLKRFSIVQDVTFLPPMSNWTLRAQKLGLKVGFGYEMFAHQGAEQIKLITGLEPDMTFMSNLVKDGLSKS